MILSVVIPVYNEKDTLLELLQRVVETPVPLEREILLIDDGSTDGTDALFQEVHTRYPNTRIRLFKHDVNRGKGAAIRTGFAHAQGDIILIQDADLEYDPNDYPSLLTPILEDRADVVYGSRFRNGDPGHHHFTWHRFGNRALTMLSNLFTHLKLTDMETCYKVFKSNVVKGMQIRCNRFGIEPELTAKIARHGWRVHEVGIRYIGRSYKEGKKITWRDGLKAVYCIVRFAIAD